VNYLDKTPSTFFGILQAGKTEKAASGNRKCPVAALQIISLDAICGILVSNMPHIAG